MKNANTEALVKIKSGLLEAIEGLNILIDPSVEDGVANLQLSAEDQHGESDPHPWLTKMLEFEGQDEVDHNTELTDFLGIDPEETPWCAAIVTSCLKACGKPALGLRARDYAAYGDEGDGSIGDIAVWRSHVGIVCDEDGSVIGGNVSNMVRKSPAAGSNQDWFRNFIGFRRVV